MLFHFKPLVEMMHMQKLWYKMANGTDSMAFGFLRYH
ncbi:hypothetical protein E1A91_A10G139400v1 [Gossypium mustelinum]|uniref:Uncharacterized protein n=3 Tax=Gossypium TaxID=3633 RepID=A0A5J5U6F0_GOSBA|nr:hypothetical protein ES319_A10G135300v1 [Gossypium barbadense]TYG98847.1 hypothetical protein ES288_A10G149700v1 [Gossypium darwinii]TYJ14766.1 hypothetical protein E1A91_A10G139400v1 [Gossypium mustelinum]